MTQNQDLKFFILCSSISSALGNIGQSNYAYANSVLDSIASKRCSQGLSGTSIQWGAWDLDGDGMGNEDVLEKIQSAGLGAVTEPMGLQVLHIIENPHDFPPVFMVSPFVEQQKKKTSKQNKWFTYSTDERMTMIEIES